MTNHLIRQGKTYHVKVAIPSDVQGVLGKKAFKKSLKTADRAVAIARSGPLILQFKEAIEEARGNPTKSLDAHLEETRELLREVRKGSGLDEDALFGLQEELTEKLLKARGVRYIDQLKPKDQDQVARSFKIADGQLTPFAQHLEEYLATRALEDKTLDAMRKHILRFAKGCSMVQDVNRQAVRDFVIRLSDAKPKGLGLRNPTIKVHLGALMGYWRYLRDEGIAPEDQPNPFSEVRLPEVNRKDAGRDARKEFSVGDIRTLLDAITETKDEQLVAIFELAIYTGARIDELAKLKVEDVTVDEIKITEAKTAAGVRTIPVHPELKPTLATLLSAAKHGTDAYLVAGLVPNKFGVRSDAVGKRFGRLKKKLGYDGRYVFHSIRKTVSTQLENAGVPEGVSADILGHEKKTMTYGLYSGGSSMEQKRHAIANIDYTQTA
ncbi:MAG: tyrosine-type recombinase/integrase [Pseudomonadota bacterium]